MVIQRGRQLYRSPVRAFGLFLCDPINEVQADGREDGGSQSDAHC